MRWPWTRAAPEVRSDYTSQMVAQQYNAVEGTASQATALSVVEACISLYARSFARAVVTPSNSVLSANVLARMVRQVLSCGQSIWLMEVRSGQLMISQATSWDFYSTATGDLRARLNIPVSPDQTRAAVAASDEILNFRYSQPASAPWTGDGPLQIASTTSNLVAAVESRLTQEAQAVSGHALPSPGISDADEISSVITILKQLKGRTSLLPSMVAGWASGAAEAPRGDWAQRRIGWDPQLAMITEREQVVASIREMFGVPSSLLDSGDASSRREALRLFSAQALEPLGALFAEEASEKLQMPIRFEFPAMRAADLTARARAVGQLVTAGAGLRWATQETGFSDPGESE